MARTDEGMDAMVEDHDSTSSADIGRPKRLPPTIELKASGVTERPAAADTASVEPAPATPPESPSSDPFDSAPSDMPPPDMSEPDAAEPAVAPRPRPPVLVPALAGAVAALVVVGGSWLAWTANQSSAPDADPAVEQLAARVARVEARPAAAPDGAAGARIDALEKTVTALRNDLAATRAQAERASSALGELRSQPAGSAVDLAPVNQRLGQIERATGDLRTAVAQTNARPADDAALRRVVAASLLDTSVRQSEPYAAALAAVKPLAGDADALKPLDAFATTGVPTAAMLSRELLALLPKLAPAPTEAPAGAGWMDRLQAGATRMLHIERTDAAGAGNTAVIARATAAARSNDVATAKRELSTLAPADRAAVQPWLDKVEARDVALAASRQFAANAMTSLSQPAKPAP